MFGAEFLDILLYVTQFLAIALGLWLAFSLERVVSAKITGSQRSDSRSARIFRAFTWFALGYLLALPLIQILQVFHSLARAFLPQYAATNMIGSAWGIAPLWLWTATNAAAMLAVYAIFVSVASPWLKSKIMALDPSEISERTATLVIFSGASIAWNAVRTLVSQVHRLEIPSLHLTAPDRGVTGFLAGWLLAILLVLTIGFYHNSRQSDVPSLESVQ